MLVVVMLVVVSVCYKNNVVGRALYNDWIVPSTLLNSSQTHLQLYPSVQLNGKA